MRERGEGRLIRSMKGEERLGKARGGMWEANVKREGEMRRNRLKERRK